ncbi:hypothetical protein GCM10010412_101230 [Nonomuraea recticatena]|uniref:RidA family protein n=1 Tax=Nonomuraea recticatena TaxID=46178 RepID=A0ABN3TGV5_9ACTN
MASGFLYTAGMGPHDPVTGQVVEKTLAEQTRQVLRNLGALLAEQGLDFSHVVKVTTPLAELDRDFHGYNTVYEEYLSRLFPARTTVGSKLAGILVEIDLGPYDERDPVTEGPGPDGRPARRRASRAAQTVRRAAARALRKARPHPGAAGASWPTSTAKPSTGSRTDV